MPPQDFIDFLVCLENQHGEFVIVGAYAMGVWGYVRATGDLDVFVNPTEINAKRVVEALREFGAPISGVTWEDFAKLGTVFQMGLPPLRIDILTQVDGVTFFEAQKHRSLLPLLGRKVPILSLDHLIQNKKTTGREKDLADCIELEKLKGSSKSNKP